MEGFISYSHRDTKSVLKLRHQLHPVTQRLGLDLWIDDYIGAGDVWDKKIRLALSKARLFLFCISADLLFARYIEQVELRAAREKCDRGEALMIPVILRDCTWEWVDVFSELQAVPSGGRAIQLWKPQDTGYADAARRIGNMLKHHIEGTAP